MIPSATISKLRMRRINTGQIYVQATETEMFKNPMHVKARNHILQSGMVVSAAQSSTEARRNLKTCCDCFS